jgi:hypothetical protein
MTINPKHPSKYRVGDVVIVAAGGLKSRPWVVVQIKPVILNGARCPDHATLVLAAITSAEAAGYYLPLMHDFYTHIGTMVCTLFIGPEGQHPPPISEQHLGAVYIPAIRDWLKGWYQF